MPNQIKAFQEKLEALLSKHKDDPAVYADLSTAVALSAQLGAAIATDEAKQMITQRAAIIDVQQQVIALLKLAAGMKQ